VPLAYNQQTSKGCPGAALRATRGTAMISLTLPPLLTVGSQLLLPYGREIIEGSSRKGFGKILVYYYILSIYLTPTLNS
jgi:hypothetical protein